MSPSRVYRLAVSHTYRVLVFAMMTAFSLAGVGMIFLALSGGRDGLHGPFIILWCAAVVWNWHVLLAIPYEIRFEAPDLISFVALRRITTLPAAKLHSITPYRGGGGFYVLRYDGGKIRLFAQFTGFHEVIARIKAANPHFDVVGI